MRGIQVPYIHCSSLRMNRRRFRRVFAGAVAEGGIVKGIRVPDGQRISNSRVKPKGDVSSEFRSAVGCWLWFVMATGKKGSPALRRAVETARGVDLVAPAADVATAGSTAGQACPAGAADLMCCLLHRPADEAIAGGAAGLVYIRVKEGGEIEAAKPVMEGLTAEQQAALVAQLQVWDGAAGRTQLGSLCAQLEQASGLLSPALRIIGSCCSQPWVGPLQSHFPCHRLAGPAGRPAAAGCGQGEQREQGAGPRAAVPGPQPQPHQGQLQLLSLLSTALSGECGNVWRAASTSSRSAPALVVVVFVVCLHLLCFQGTGRVGHPWRKISVVDLRRLSATHLPSNSDASHSWMH